MRVFQSTYKDRHGETRTTKNWYIEFRDHHEITRRVTGFTDRRQTEALGRQLEQLVMMKHAGEAPDLAMTRLLESIPSKLRERLAEIGLIDQRRIAASKALGEHLDEFRQALLDKGNTPPYCDLVTARARKVIDGCKFNFWSDVTPNVVQRWIGELKKMRSAQTCNFHLQAIKQFAKWMHSEGRISDPVVIHLRPYNVRTDRKHDRRALKPDELAYLIDAAAEGPTRYGMPGDERALVYRFAAETGLRAGEIRSLTPRSFRLDGENPQVVVAAAYSKRRREDVVPLRPQHAQVLKQHLAGKAPTAAAFNLPGRSGRSLTARMIRSDLEQARNAWLKEVETEPAELAKRSESSFLSYRDGDGRVADFHALRHTFITNLADAGVHPKTAQSLARHGSITLTMDRYSHSDQDKERAALLKLPIPSQANGRISSGRNGREGTSQSAADDELDDADGDSVLALCLARPHGFAWSSVDSPDIQNRDTMPITARTGGGAVERAGLENRCKTLQNKGETKRLAPCLRGAGG